MVKHEEKSKRALLRTKLSENSCLTSLVKKNEYGYLCKLDPK